MDGKLIINAALTGMVPTKRDNTHVPVTPAEIAADARRCVDAGASIVHLHARDDAGAPTSCRERNREILRRVREVCADVILCVSTSGRVESPLEKRSAVLEVDDPRAEMASLTLGSMNFAQQASVNSPEIIRALALRMQERGIVPELEIFELGMAEYTHYLIKHGVLRPPLYANILLGSLGTLRATEFNLLAAVRALPAGTTWAAAGIGRFQYDMNALAIRKGGHVRVGLEDNLWFDSERTVPATNPALVDRLARLARAEGREPATPDEARQIIGLSRERIVSAVSSAS